MKKLFLKDVIKITQAKILQGQDNLIIEDLARRCKRVKQGTLFFDLHKNDNVSEQVQLFNLSFVIVSDNPSRFIGIFNNATIIQVKDVEAAYWKFVEYYRSLFDIPVVGVTGTCGKTTTKEMIRHILAQKMKVNSTYKSYNAQIHHLKYLLDINDETQAAVIEMGVAFPGDLKIACRYFKPQVGVITNIGIDHLNAFGSQEQYIKGKAEFIEGLDYKGTLIINVDDENIKKIDFSKFHGKLVKFGYDKSSQFRIINVKQRETGIEFVLQNEGLSYHFTVPGFGEFLAKNAVAAIAAAHAVGFEVKEAGEALGTFHNVERHFEVKEGIGGGLVIDDTWSTNPTSAVEALKVLKNLSKGKKTIAALGKMSLLGKQSVYYHNKVGKEVAKMGLDELVIIGEDAKDIGIGALTEGMPPEHVHFCADSKEVLEALYNMMNKDTITLIKTTMLASYKDVVKKVTTGVI
jgi:UDP-N-acetylmuramoyl-tripeptide--D-alanyl-D-alanine ligase